MQSAYAALAKINILKSLKYPCISQSTFHLYDVAQQHSQTNVYPEFHIFHIIKRDEHSPSSSSFMLTTIMSETPANAFPVPGTRAHRANGAIVDFLCNHPTLKLGGDTGFVSERCGHQSIFGIHKIPKDRVYPIQEVEFTAIRGPHGTIPIRVLYPASGEDWRKGGEAAGLIYFHGGGYTIGSVDEFENGLRLVAEQSGCQIYCVEYRLAPEFRYPVQLDEYDAVIDWLQGEGGMTRGIRADRLAGGGDSAGGNLTASICLRRRDQGKRPLCAQILLYPEARLPFDTLAAKQNNTGYYLQANGIFGFADNYLPRPTRPNAGPTPRDRYISPGMQSPMGLRNVPKALVVTNGFDPLRDVGIEYAGKLKEAGVDVYWIHFDDMTHGFLQMTPWSHGAGEAARAMAKAVGDVIYGKDVGNK